MTKMNPNDFLAEKGSFGWAVNVLQRGGRVARAGWNGVKPIVTKYGPKGRTPILFEGLGYVKLDDGSVSIFDEGDYELVAGKTWCIAAGGYAYYTDTQADGTRHTVSMAKLMLPCADVIDHANGDRRDNRRANLRPCTTQQNNFNRVALEGTSRYKGVSFDTSRARWIASIMVNGKTNHLGRHVHEIDAARAYDAAAEELHGEFARLNFPKPRMWLILVPGSPELTVDEGRPLHKAGLPLGMAFSYAPHIDMFTADKKLVPWLASQTDVLADDWTEVGA